MVPTTTHTQPIDRRTPRERTTVIVPLMPRVVSLLQALVSLDRSVRQTRTRQDSRATAFASQTITSTTSSQLDIVQGNLDHPYASALITFDATTPAMKYRLDGGAPTTTLGMDTPPGANTLIVTGMDNLRNFRVIATAGSPTMSYTLFD